MKRAAFTANLLVSLLSFVLANPARAESALADLIQDGRRAEALRLVDQGTDLNGAQNDGTTPLHWAVYRKDLALVERLLENGANAAVTNRFGASPLAEAVKVADGALVEALLQAGADPESANRDGQTALMLAMRTGSIEIAGLLVEHGANVNASETWRGQTALMWAADGGYPELTQYLIDEGADVTTRAVVNDWGSQITSEPRAQYRPTGGLTPLLFAARSGCLDCIRAIVSAGEAIDRPTPEGVTPLMLAIDNLNFDAADLLLDLGANPYYSDWWGRTALYLAVDMNSDIPGVPNGWSRGRAGADDGDALGKTAVDIMNRLLAAGAEVNTQLNMHRVGRGGNSQRFTDDLLTTGATPLLRAAIMHDHETMRILLDNGALVDLPNVMGVTPLMAAASVGVRDVDFGSNRSPSFATDERIEEKVIESLEILLAAGADINAPIIDTSSRSARIARPSSISDRESDSREGQTAIFRAAGQGWAEVVSFMIANGGRVDIVDKLGQSPVDIAMGREASGDPVYENVAAILEAPTNN
jgi:ankyrin repeat protein